MKIKLFLSALMLMVGTLTATYASFPVQRTTTNNKNTTVVVENQEDELSSPAILADGKSQIVALILCFFVGGIGIHRFYLGYTLEGVIQLLTFGACGVWTLIDFIRICTGDLKPKNGSYSEKL